MALEYTYDGAIAAPTEVFVNRLLHYPHGLDVNVSSAVEVTQRNGTAANYLEFHHTPGGGEGRVSIDIVAKSAPAAAAQRQRHL